MPDKLEDVLFYSVDNRVMYLDGFPFKVAQTPQILGDLEILGMTPSTLFVGLETLTQEITIMAFSLSDLQVQILDQANNAAGGISVDTVNVTDINTADITVDITPDTLLGSVKAVVQTQHQTFTKDYIGIKVANSLSWAALPGNFPGKAAGDGVLPLQGGSGSHSLAYTGFGFFHGSTAIFGAAGLTAHQPGITGLVAGWQAGSYVASPADIAAGAEVPCLVDVLGGSHADSAMASVNALIQVNSVAIGGRTRADRENVSVTITLPDTGAFADSLLPAGKQPAKLRAQSWNGTTGMRSAEMSAVAFEVALRPVSSGSSKMDIGAGDVNCPTTADPASYSGPVLVAGSSTGTLEINTADSNGNACLGAALSHTVRIQHSVYSAKELVMAGSLALAADGKVATQGFSVPSDSPIGIYNILVGGDQNGAGEVNAGQVIVSAAPISITGAATLQLISATPGAFDAAENGLQEWGEKGTWQVDVGGGGLSEADEDTFIYAYLTKGGARYEFVDAECSIDSDTQMTLSLDLTSAAAAAHLDGAAFTYAAHCGDFTLHVELFDRADIGAGGFASSGDMFGAPAVGAAILSQGTLAGLLITSESPAAVDKGDLTMTDSQPAEYAGVMTPEQDRWLQAGSDSTLGAAQTFKFAAINAASAANAPGHNDAGAPNLHNTYVQIIRTSDNAVVGDSREGAAKLAGNHGDGSGELLFHISSLSVADRLGGSYPAGGQWLNAAGRDQVGLVTEIEFDVQAVHEVGQDSGEASVGVEVSMDAGYGSVETSDYQVEIVTRAVDIGASEDALTFAGDASFRVFPRQIAQASLANAVIQIAPNGTTLTQVLQLIVDRGLYPTSGGMSVQDALAALYASVGAGYWISGAGGSYTLKYDASGLITELEDSSSNAHAGGMTVTTVPGGAMQIILNNVFDGGQYPNGTVVDGVKGYILMQRGDLTGSSSANKQQIAADLNSAPSLQNIAEANVMDGDNWEVGFPANLGTDWFLVYLLPSNIV